MARTKLSLRKLNGSHFYLREGAIEKITNSLDSFLSSETRLNSRAFAKRAVFSHEIRTNNQVEGYNDDIADIEAAIRNIGDVSIEKKTRIKNLYNAYGYILKRKPINKETLKELYAIISKDLLERKNLEEMGEYYRTRPVYILRNGRLDIYPDQGVPADKIDEFMNMYFKFLHTKIIGNETDEYIKSQILHFFFVYIHPYFDVNGRTSRTLAMWYLLNKKAYAYVIFNRGIAFKGSAYTNTIIKSKETGDLTYFINLMLETVRTELEKEYVMQEIACKCTSELSITDYQTLLYFLSMNGEKTILDFANIYKYHSEYKSIERIYEEMIKPLLDKGVLDTVGDTKKIYHGVHNKKLALRPLDLDPKKVQSLKL